MHLLQMAMINIIYLYENIHIPLYYNQFKADNDVYTETIAKIKQI